jgi:hypothetical protein
MNVGVKNVEKIVQTVLEKMASIKVDRLPKKTFSETMLIEAKILAQLQATEAMLDGSNNTLHTDGTKRGGREFGKNHIQISHQHLGHKFLNLLLLELQNLPRHAKCI